MRKNVMENVTEEEKNFLEVFFKFFLVVDKSKVSFGKILLFVTQPSKNEGWRETAIFRKCIKIFRKYFTDEDPEYGKVFSNSNL